MDYIQQKEMGVDVEIQDTYITEIQWTRLFLLENLWAKTEAIYHINYNAIGQSQSYILEK